MSEGQESIRSGWSDSESNLRELVSHPHVIEVLDALRRGPMTLAEIRSRVPAGRRGLASALKVVATYGLVTRTEGGSWDVEAATNALYRHTDLGRLTVDTLSRFSVWTAMFESR
jgi:DNA-binding HxlR family transcriptional regulator